MIARLSLATALLASSAHAADERVLDRIAAVIDGEVIALSDVYEMGGEFISESCRPTDEACRAQIEVEVLDALIRRTLQRHTLRDLDADVGPSEVDQAIDSIVRDNGFPDRQALRAEVERSGLGWEAYREELKSQIREMRFNDMVLRNRVTIPEDEVRDAYRRLVDDVEPPIVVRLAAAATRLPDDGALWAPIVEEARAAVAAVRAGEQTWEQLAATWDGLGLEPVFQERTFREGELAKSLSKAAFGTPTGEITDPVIAGGVLYLLRIDERGEGEREVASFEEARPALEQKLFEGRMQDAMDEWEARARREASIKVLLGADEAASPETPAPPAEAAPGDGEESP